MITFSMCAVTFDRETFYNFEFDSRSFVIPMYFRPVFGLVTGEEYTEYSMQHRIY